MLLETRRDAVAVTILAANLGSLLLCLVVGNWYYWAWATFGALWGVTGLVAIPVGIGLLVVQLRNGEEVAWSIALLSQRPSHGVHNRWRLSTGST
jgi:hypothetical protein